MVSKYRAALTALYFYAGHYASFELADFSSYSNSLNELYKLRIYHFQDDCSQGENEHERSNFNHYNDKLKELRICHFSSASLDLAVKCRFRHIELFHRIDSRDFALQPLSITVSNSGQDFGFLPLYTPSALAMAMPSRWR